MVCIVLYVQSDESLRYSVYDSHGKGSLGGNPKILQIKEERDVTDRSEIPSKSSEFTASTDNFENFLFDLTLERSIKLVSV